MDVPKGPKEAPLPDDADMFFPSTPQQAPSQWQLLPPEYQPPPSTFIDPNLHIRSVYGDSSVPSAPSLKDLNSEGKNSGENDALLSMPLLPSEKSGPALATFYQHSPSWASLERGVGVDLPHGYLFVGVLRARGFGDGLKGQDTNPFVRLHVRRGGATKATELEGKVVEKCTEPSFYEEFLFTVLDGGTSTLELRVYHKKRIGKDPLIGSLSISIASIASVPVRQWFPLTQQSGTPGAEVELVLVFSRCALDPRYERKEIVEQLDVLRLCTDRKNLFAGELVQGLCTYSVRGSPKEIYYISFKARGFVCYHTSYHSDNSTHHCYEVKEIFSHKEVLLGDRKNKKNNTTLTLEPNRYVWPIRLWLPPQCPPSLYWDDGQCGIQVQYRFEATVHVKGALKRDKTTYVPFRVLVRYVSPQPYVRTASMGFAFEKKKDAKVCITASMVSSECFPGQDVVVNISLKNGSSKTIKNGAAANFGQPSSWAHQVIEGTLMSFSQPRIVTNFFLLRRLLSSLYDLKKALASGHHSFGSLSFFRVDLATVPTLLPLNPGEEKASHVTLRVPNNAQPTCILAQGQLVWGVRVGVKYGLKHRHTDVPLLVQPLCPNALRWFPVVPTHGTTEDAALVPGALTIEQTPHFMPWWSFLP